MPDRWKWDLVRGTNLKTEDRHCLLTLFLIQGENHSAWCKQETLAAEIGVDPRSVRRSLKRLNEAGIVASEWKGRNGVGMRQYSIDFAKLKTVQRSEGRTPASGLVGHQRPGTQDTSVLQEDPLKIQGTSTLGKSPISLASSARKPKRETDSKLTTFCVEWNNWHSAGIVRQKIRDTNSPGKTIVDAWNRSQRDPEQRERLRDVAGLRAAIQSSQILLKPAAWFDAAGLIGGKNSNRRWYAEQLVAGTYRDKPAIGAASSEAMTAWQNVQDSLKTHSRFKPELIMGDIGQRAWDAIRAFGLKRLDESTDFDRRELQKQFIQEFNRQGAAA